jgi:hypothetical protein
MQSTRYSCLISIKLELYGQIFEKYSHTKFHENPSVAFRNFVTAPKYFKQEIIDLWQMEYRSQGYTCVFPMHNRPMGKSEDVPVLTRN